MDYFTLSPCFFLWRPSQTNKRHLKKQMRTPCCDKQANNKGAWSKQEDQKLIAFIKTHGEGCWRSLPKAAGLHRCGKSCRLRWINYLRPDIKRGNFTQDEEDLIVKLHALLGNRWSLIAGRLPGRTDNEVKNYWNSHLRKKLINMGIDPNNHRLNQFLHVPQPQRVSSPVDEATRKIKGDYNDRVSDVANSLEEDETSGAPYHINLDLTMAVPSPARTATFETRPENCHATVISEVRSKTLPTLLLFL